MLPGETILSGAPSTCPECGREVQFQVCQSAAGYYIGTMCDCGPYTRESDYMHREQAQAAVRQWLRGNYVWARQ